MGSLLWGSYADRAGRRPALLAAAGLMLASSLLSTAAPSYPALLAARALTGVGLSGVVVSNTMAMELCPAACRGFCQTSTATAWALGVALGGE